MKVRFNSDDDLPLGKILKIYEVAILIRFVFYEKNTFCSPIYLEKYLEKLLDSIHFD